MMIERREAKVVLISLLSLAVLFSALSAWGCEKSEPGPDGRNEAGADVVEPRPETVSFTLYFRGSDGGGEWLYAEERTVTDVSDPCRAAMEELISGPAPGSGLYAVLPSTVRVLDVEVADGVCTVNVSGEILSDAAELGVSASGEELALAAIANTLTELDGVEKVKLLVEGVQSGMVDGRFVEDFWGHMGLPEYLERDEGLIR